MGRCGQCGLYRCGLSENELVETDEEPTPETLLTILTTYAKIPMSSRKSMIFSELRNYPRSARFRQNFAKHPNRHLML